MTYTNIGVGEKQVFTGGTKKKKSGSIMVIELILLAIFANLILIYVDMEKYFHLEVLIPMAGFSIFCIVIALVYYIGSKKSDLDPPTLIIDENSISIKWFFWHSSKSKPTLTISRKNIVKIISNFDWRACEEIVKQYKQGLVKIHDSEKMKEESNNVDALLYKIVGRSFAIIDQNGVHYFISKDFQDLDKILNLLSPTPVK